MTNELVNRDDQSDIAPRTYADLLDFAHMVASSGLAPKDYVGKPEACMIAMQWGHELGLQPLQSLQNIAVIGNRPSLWGDAVLALVTSSPACEDVIEYFEDEGTKDMTAVCIAKRRGKEDKTRRFSLSDAQTAGLVGKDVWQKYPKRMLQMRARGYALRDQFPDVLRGLPIAELVREAVDMGRVEEVDQATGEIKNKGNVPPASSAGTRADSIKSKLRRVTLAAVIDDADSSDALKAAGELASRLTDDEEKKQARGHWQAKLNAEKAKGKDQPKDQPKDDTKQGPQDPAFTVTFAEVASSIAGAERRGDRDALAAAADLISHVADPDQQKELTALYEAAMRRLGDGDDAGATA